MNNSENILIDCIDRDLALRHLAPEHDFVFYLKKIIIMIRKLESASVKSCSIYSRNLAHSFMSLHAQMCSLLASSLTWHSWLSVHPPCVTCLSYLRGRTVTCHLCQGLYCNCVIHFGRIITHSG